MTSLSLNVFGEINQDAILVPEIAIGLRNNCQSGAWTLGDMPAGNKLHCSILKFSKFFGDLGATKNTLWGQIWLVAEFGSSEDIPDNCVLVTYIKNRSLTDFNRLIITFQSKGINPAMGVFCPKYIKHSKGLADGTTATYYSLEWHWRDRTPDDNSIEKLSDCLHGDKFIDCQGTSKMKCLDGLPASEIQQIIAGQQPLLVPEVNF